MTDHQPSVLLVDDAPSSTDLERLEAALASLPCQLVRARSGHEALRRLLEREHAAVLLDAHMPGIDGYEIARHARDNPATRDVPIIFVTATHESDENVLRGYDSGAYDVMLKPVDPQILRSKVKVFLDLYMSRRRLQAEIEAHKETLAELEAFSYSVSHDLRAPLRPLDGFSEVLLHDYGSRLDERGRDYLQRIRAAALRMGQLTEDLLKLSRVSRLEIRAQPVDLSALVELIVDELRAADPQRDVVLDREPGVEVQGDPRLLRIAVENLLRNAWKFTHKRPRAHIQFGRGRRAGEENVYFVRDDGVGFDPAHAARLFRPFQRLHAASEFEGTGIGLAIVDRIIRRHDGRIWADAKLEGGATFWFRLGAGPGT